MNFKEILDVFKEPAFLIDRERKIIACGQGVGEMGYRPESLVGSSLESLMSPPFRGTAEAVIETAFKVGRPTSVKVEVLNAFSETVPAELRVVALEEKGQARFLSSIYPQSAINYSLLEEVNLPIWVMDLRGNVIFKNDAAKPVLRRLGNILPRDGEEIKLKDLSYITKVREVADRFQRVRVVILLNTQSLLADKLNRFVVAGVLASLVAHDVKNAISSTILLTDLIDDPSLRKRIYNGVMRIYRIHQRILNLARGKVEAQEVRLDEVVNEVLDDLKHKLLRKSIKVRREYPKDFTLKTDRNALYEILLNLISNAIDASIPGGEVVVAAGVSHNVSSGKMEKFISIRDSGPGIPPDRLDKIFAPLFTSKKNGMGLGLFIVKLLSSSVGAHVKVKSEPGKGAEFMVLFPAES
ncbi:MAG: PAS domain S-box protein [Thermotogae bacterium]|nr:PAS domain S-box protein [Thermotogota bacterium]